MNTLQGRVVVITGAAGGLGSALSRGFAREGCRLFLTDKHEGRLTEIMAELAKEGATVAGEPVDASRDCFYCFRDCFFSDAITVTFAGMDL